ncbi:crustacyanin-A2 subunit-like [Penaeus chinensis]|uniref:crustacyanin-A2 subunit-like n=1 Tax=Penaeus chinensis TaxID=139456 RepID=UPI001FB65335|nr:crustacyanin-A2 subunit-like [Penaeus chinensis]
MVLKIGWSDYDFKVTIAGFSLNAECSRLKGKIYPTKDFPAAHMLIDFPSVFAAPYGVIDTDYDSYSCIDTDKYKSEFGSVFSRTPQNAGSAIDRCASVFRRNGVDFSLFIIVPHTAECVYSA